jgi:hypothetical protein
VTRPLLVQSAARAKRECARTTHGPRPHLRVSDGQSPGALRSAGMADRCASDGGSGLGGGDRRRDATPRTHPSPAIRGRDRLASLGPV